MEDIPAERKTFKQFLQKKNTIKEVKNIVEKNIKKIKVPLEVKEEIKTKRSEIQNETFEIDKSIELEPLEICPPSDIFKSPKPDVV